MNANLTDVVVANPSDEVTAQGVQASPETETRLPVDLAAAAEFVVQDAEFSDIAEGN